MSFEEIAKTFKVPTKMVEEKYNEIVAGFKVTRPDLQGEALEQETQAVLHHIIRSVTKNSKGELYVGMVLAVDRVKDNAAATKTKPSKRQAQVDAYVADPEGAIAAGKVAVLTTNADGTVTRKMKNRKTGEVLEDIVNEDVWKGYTYTFDNKKVVPLNDMKSWPNGKDNFKYLQNLPLHEYRTSMLIALKTDEGYKLANMDYQSEKELPEIPRHVEVEFVAVPREDKGDGIVHLGTSAFTSFNTTGKNFGKTPVELMDAFLAGITYPIGKLTDYHTKMVKDGKQWDTLVMVKAWITDIRGIEKGAPYLLINDNTIPDDEDDLKVWLHEGININFAKNSRVYIIGKTSQGDKYDSETRQVMKGVPGDVTLWAMEVYTVYNTKPTNIQSITEVVL